MVESGAEQALHLRERQVHTSGGERHRHFVDQALQHLSPGESVDEESRPGRGSGREVRIDAPFEASRGLRAEPVPAGHPHDRRWVPAGRLEQHPGGLVTDLGRFSPHGPCQAHRSGAVTDHDVLGGQSPGHAVEGDEGLAVVGAPDHEEITLHLVGVEGVEGVAELDHDVVGDVHHVVDGPDPRRLESPSHPQWRRTHPEVADLPQGEAVAAGRVGYLDLGGRGTRDGGVVVFRPSVRDPVVGGQLPGHPDHRHRVGPVGRHFEFEHHVGELHDLLQGPPRDDLVGQDEDPLVVVGQPELPFRADHPVGFDSADAPHLQDRAVGEPRAGWREGDRGAGLEVPCTAHHFEHLGPQVHPTHSEAVGVRVGLGGDDLGGHHIRPPGFQVFDGFDLEPQPGESPGDLPRVGGGQLEEVAQPSETHTHFATSITETASRIGDRCLRRGGCRRSSDAPWRDVPPPFRRRTR